ncbi:MAG: hypothetical protein ABS909_02745 [Arthrobacter sp.]
MREPPQAPPAQRNRVLPAARRRRSPTGVEGTSSSAGVMVLGLGALIAGAAVLAVSMRSKGNHS